MNNHIKIQSLRGTSYELDRVYEDNLNKLTDKQVAVILGGAKIDNFEQRAKYITNLLAEFSPVFNI